jgi:hypothetical protein
MHVVICLLTRIAVCAVVFFVAGCESSYIITPARLILSEAENVSISDLPNRMGPMLEAKGFDDLGIDEGMMDLARRTAPDEATAALGVFERLHEYTYLNERRNLRVEVSDYTDAARRRPTGSYVVPVGPFFEIRVYEHRPGGFSASGHRFFAELQENFATLDVLVTLETPSLATDKAEYWRTTLAGLFGGIFIWLTVFGVTVAVTGGISYVALKWAPIPVLVKRGVFVLVNTWLATPLPFPIAKILTWTLPNFFAFPWTYVDYYRRVLDVALVSFPLSLALCVLIARRAFVERRP